MLTVTVGFTTAPRDDVVLSVPPGAPKPNRNEREKMVATNLKLALLPYAGFVDSVSANVFEKGELINDYDLCGESDLETGIALAEAMMAKDSGCRFVGFDINNFAKIIQYACIEHKKLELLDFFRQKCTFENLLASIWPDECRKLVSLDIVLKRLKIRLPEEMSYMPGDDSELDLDVLEQMLRAIGGKL